ncbi:hypothetical protein QBC43DRAFT_245255 [Cladorrhinum sp. PSN259]|nr:hypothetical protein QBC43DRAFT_245255 [Cladorrhinum sp. PSN259]
MKLDQMETIHEMSPRSATMPSPGAEALMFTVRSATQAAQGDMTGPNTARQGRSASMKALPTARKPSFRVRDWVKRSNTSGALRTTASDVTPGSNTTSRPKITHLGGGRVEDPERPVRRPQQGRASSVESRRTQWLDFYAEEPTASSNPPRQAQQKPVQQNLSPSPNPPRQVQQTPVQQKPVQQKPVQQNPSPSPNPSLDLRPLPLRVPSLERNRDRSTPKQQSSGDTKPELVRKNSLWKALPNLPVQQLSVTTSPEASTSSDVEQLMGKIILDNKAAVIPPIPELEATTRTEQSPVASSPQKKQRNPVPMLDEYGTPPPTPDSDAGGVARRQPQPKPSQSVTISAGETVRLETKTFTFPKRTQSLAHAHTNTHTHTITHTRQERVWLHANYRGEAPFLEAWGLDISRKADREEGLAILRELMLEEGNSNKKI